MSRERPKGKASPAQRRGSRRDMHRATDAGRPRMPRNAARSTHGFPDSLSEPTY